MLSDSMEQAIVAFAIATLVVVVVAATMGFVVKRKQEGWLPPGPKGWPIIGNLGLVRKGVFHQILTQLSKRYGPLLYLRLGSMPMVVISSMELAKEALLTHDKVFSHRRSDMEFNKRVFWNKGIAFMPADNNWREFRKICSKELFSPNRLLSYQQVLQEETSSMLQRMYTHSVKSPSTPVELKKDMVDWASNVMGHLLFSTTSFVSRDGVIDIRDVIRELAMLFSTPLVGDFIPSLGCIFDSKVKASMDRAHNICNGLLQGLIEERRQPIHQSELGHMLPLKQNTPRDFLDVLLVANESGQYDHYNKDDDSVKATLMDLFAGGIETTSIFLEWAMAELLRNPTKLSKLKLEIEDVVGHEHMVSHGNMPKLPYLKAVIKETFRLHPPLPLLVPHQSNENCEFGGYVIPSETRILVNVWAIGRDPSVWDSPDEFSPERFINNTIDFSGHHFELLPFGSGRRICPGMSLATHMIELTLSNLVHAFDWSLPQGIVCEELDMSEMKGVSVCKLVPLLLIPKAKYIEHFMNGNK